MKSRTKRRILSWILALAALILLYFVWAWRAGPLFNEIYSLLYEPFLETQMDPDSDYFSYDKIPEALLAGQALLPAGPDPALDNGAAAGEPPGGRGEYQGGSITLKIPRLGVNAPVEDGVGAGALRKGPGLYPGSALPGEAGGIWIAAYRDTFGAWFQRLETLRPGDPIVLEYQGKQYRYTYEKIAVALQDGSGLEEADRQGLLLTTKAKEGNGLYMVAVCSPEEG